MDKISLKGLRFYGYHGCLPAENELGQTFIIDAELSADLKQAGKSDALKDTVNYAAVFACIEVVVTQKRFKLLEALGETICEEIFAAFPQVLFIQLTIQKPQAPIEGDFDSVGVSIERKRS